ncbi:hypothetical protein D3C72_2174630 [compost metagenome]
MGLSGLPDSGRVGHFGDDVRAKTLPDFAHRPLANQVVVRKKAHRQQAIGERRARKIIQRDEFFPHAFQQCLAGRIAQQRADPWVTGHGREIAIGKMLALD